MARWQSRIASPVGPAHQVSRGVSARAPRRCGVGSACLIHIFGGRPAACRSSGDEKRRSNAVARCGRCHEQTLLSISYRGGVHSSRVELARASIRRWAGSPDGERAKAQPCARSARTALLRAAAPPARERAAHPRPSAGRERTREDGARAPPRPPGPRPRRRPPPSHSAHDAHPTGRFQDVTERGLGPQLNSRSRSLTAPPSSSSRSESVMW